jgi:hypothetical protein
MKVKRDAVNATRKALEQKRDVRRAKRDLQKEAEFAAMAAAAEEEDDEGDEGEESEEEEEEEKVPPAKWDLQHRNDIGKFAKQRRW